MFLTRAPRVRASVKATKSTMTIKTRTTAEIDIPRRHPSRFPIPWRIPGGSREYSAEAADKPIVLEKPARFNPPSHGSARSMWRMPKLYGYKFNESGGPQVKTTPITKHYPGLEPPEGSWQHWLVHNRWIHLFISMGVLGSLAISTFVLNFQHNSPFKHLVPPFDTLVTDPARFFGSWGEAIRLHEADRNRKVIEARNHMIEDVAKRREYMRAHGIDNSFQGKFFGGDEPSTRLSEDYLCPTDARQKREQEAAMQDAAAAEVGKGQHHHHHRHQGRHEASTAKDIGGG